MVEITISNCVGVVVSDDEMFAEPQFGLEETEKSDAQCFAFW